MSRIDNGHRRFSLKALPTNFLTLRCNKIEPSTMSLPSNQKTAVHSESGNPNTHIATARCDPTRKRLTLQAFVLSQVHEHADTNPFISRGSSKS